MSNDLIATPSAQVKILKPVFFRHPYPDTHTHIYSTAPEVSPIAQWQTYPEAAWGCLSESEISQC